jgi:hypothetical protein
VALRPTEPVTLPWDVPERADNRVVHPPGREPMRTRIVRAEDDSDVT